MLYSAFCLLSILVVICTVGTALLQWAAWNYSNRPVNRPRDTPPISILKPLSGLDEGLLANLRSIAAQNYPSFEIVFGVQDPRDPALDVVAVLREEYPTVAMRCVVGGLHLGLNPKVKNLAAMTQQARYDFLLVSDANVRVGPDYLRNLISEFNDERVGLVSSVIIGDQARTLGAHLEDLHLNCFIAPAVYAARVAGHPCVVGKSMLLRRADLTALGGWQVVRDVLAEDYVMGQLYHKAGWRVALSPCRVQAVHLRRPIRDFVGRHVRWAQMRRRICLCAYASELLLSPGLLAGALLLVSCSRGSLFGALLAASMMGVRWVNEWTLMRHLLKTARWPSLVL